MLTQMLGAVGQRGLLEVVLGRALEGVREVAQGLGDGTVAPGSHVGDVRLGAHGAELELVAREGERARAVAVGVVLLEVGQQHRAEGERVGGGVDARLAVHQHLDDLGELVAQEDRHDRRRGLVGAETVVVAAAGDAGAQEVLVLVDGLDDRSKEHHELQVLERGVAGVEEVFVGRTGDQLLCLPEPLMPSNGFSCSRHTRSWRLAMSFIFSIIEIVVNGHVELGIHGREFVLARRHLVVLRLAGMPSAQSSLSRSFMYAETVGRMAPKSCSSSSWPLHGAAPNNVRPQITRSRRFRYASFLMRKYSCSSPTEGTTRLGCLPNRASTRLACSSRAVIERSSGVFYPAPRRCRSKTPWGCRARRP